ncbi:metallophosphoesterase [Streptosporangium soli]|nr:metallophosphoesterase [Streptosporangium sp. KLBMP 9127]
MVNIGFVVVLVVLMTGVHYYLWRRLVRDVTRRGRTRQVLTGLVVVLGLLTPVAVLGSRIPWAHTLAWPGFFWIALMFYLVIFLAVLEIPRAVAARMIRSSPRPAVAASDKPPAPVPVPVAASDKPPAPVPVPLPSGPPPPAPVGPASDLTAAGPGPDLIGRRLFLGRTAAAVAGVGALGTVGLGIRTALGDPVIERVSIAVPKLDPRMNGLRFAVVSDIHLGPLTGRAHTERIVRMINSLEADVVAIVGDLVDGTVAQLGSLAKPLRSLESRYGSYFVTGNHEYYAPNGPQEWVEELRDLGVRPLRNERVEISHGGGVLDLAGVNDLTGVADGDGPDLGKAFAGRDASRAAVLLAHQPEQVHEAARNGVDLQLSGHTHGGQMAPFNMIVKVQQPVVAGLATVDGTQVYVTRGAGFWGPPVRVGAPPEISLLRLHA